MPSQPAPTGWLRQSRWNPYVVGAAIGVLAFVLPLAVAAGAAFGAAWAFIPAWLQARRGSHVVITTIMFNFIASALMTYLLVNVLVTFGYLLPWAILAYYLMKSREVAA